MSSPLAQVGSKTARREEGKTAGSQARKASAPTPDLLPLLADPTEWITDDVIDFAVAHDIAATVANVQFVPASVVVAHLADPSAALPARVADIVLLPVSHDNRHWSLLVCDTVNARCIHYDSMGGTNGEQARGLFQGLKDRQWLPRDAEFVAPSGLVQADTYNCGMFVIELMERIAQSGNAELDGQYLATAVTSDICDARRRLLLDRFFGIARLAPPPSLQRSGGGRRTDLGLGTLLGVLGDALLQRGPERARQLHAIFRGFVKAVALKLSVHDEFLRVYEPFYTAYHRRKATLSQQLGLPEKLNYRSGWPQLPHALIETRSRKRTRDKGARYRSSSLQLDTLELTLADEQQMFDAMLQLLLWRKVFSRRFSNGSKDRGVAHMLRIACPYGAIWARNVKNTEGNGTTRMLLPLDTAPPCYIDASYRQLHDLLKKVAQATKTSDEEVARALLYLVFGGQEPVLAYNSTLAFAPGEVVQENWSSIVHPQLFEGSDTPSNPGGLRDLSGMTKSITKIEYRLKVGHVLSYVASVLFLAEARHAHALWLGNRYILELVAQGSLTFADIFTDFSENAHSGNLIPSYQYKPQYTQFPTYYRPAKNRLLITGILGQFSGREEDPNVDDFLDVRRLLSGPKSHEDEPTKTKLFTVHKILFAWLLLRLTSSCDPRNFAGSQLSPKQSSSAPQPAYARGRGLVPSSPISGPPPSGRGGGRGSVVGPLRSTTDPSPSTKPGPLTNPSPPQSAASSSRRSSIFFSRASPTQPPGQRPALVSQGQPAVPFQARSTPIVSGRGAPPAQGPPVSAPTCPKCRAPMMIKDGRFGQFWGCTLYRATGCKGTRNF